MSKSPAPEITAAPGVIRSSNLTSGGGHGWFASGSWSLFAVRRGGRFAGSVVALVTVAFLMLQLIPGDPARASLGPTASIEAVALRRHELGLDQSLVLQYLQFWRGLLTGQPGDSISLRVPVADVIASRFPATAQLALLTLAVVLVLAIPLGLLAAAMTRGGRRRGIELGFNSTAGFFAVIPEFLLGVGLIYVFAVSFHVFPVAGQSGPLSYVLPVAALSIGSTAALARIVRSEALGVLEQDYLRTARAKRMPPLRVYLRHALPNLMTSTLTIAGLFLGSLIAGTVLVETIFAWPGLGTTIVSSILTKDYPLAQTLVVVYGGIVLLINLLVDVLLAVLDPRSTIKES
ncbi:ABC transporter permease [Arthrobacter cryoconiti]|uniref:ABC transporter permease n=1 Tax=Arthrobacter cryoconiti TaxID=748907 RepID=A0ABV8R2N3_9MICC|nr:ABC transporter permease [Arthrobacter cryoconiti]MCC9067111.1 ABC transporter permease [Arthrobacter cryoconiti]